MKVKISIFKFILLIFFPAFTGICVSFIIAKDVMYDNLKSELDANNVQDAIDKLDESLDIQKEKKSLNIIVKDANSNFIGYQVGSPYDIYIPEFKYGSFHFSNGAIFYYLYYTQENCKGIAYTMTPSQYIVDTEQNVFQADVNNAIYSSTLSYSYSSNARCDNGNGGYSERRLYPLINAGKFPYKLPLETPFQIEILD